MVWVWHNKKDKGAQNMQFVYELKQCLTRLITQHFDLKLI